MPSSAFWKSPARSDACGRSFLLLDEPAGGLTGPRSNISGAVIGVMRDSGIGVLLVEHHTDFVFRICDRVTALDLRPA